MGVLIKIVALLISLMVAVFVLNLLMGLMALVFGYLSSRQDRKQKP